MKKIKYYDVIFITSFLLGFLFLFYKLHYGYFYNDEPFIFSIGYRFAKGDIIFVHEWSVAVLTGFLVYPFAKIYMLFNSSTEGIILFGRYCYLVLWSLTVMFAYINLRKYKIFNTFACISLYMFAPLDMMTLSYNSFCIIGLVISSVMIINAKSYFNYILIGFFFSISVLAIPYMIFVYLLFTLIMILNLFIKKIKLPNDIDLFKAWLFLNIGCGINVILFMIFILKSRDITAVVCGLNNILQGNTEHIFLEPLSLIYKYFYEISQRFYGYMIASIILIVILFLDKNRLKHKIIYFSIASIIITISFIKLWFLKSTYPNLNLTVMPLTIIGIIAYILSENKNKHLFIYFVLLGFVYSFIFLQASNLGLPALGTGYVIIMFGSILLLQNIFITNKNTLKLIIIYVMFIQIGFQFAIRYINYYQDEPIYMLTDKIEIGPGKGIYTNINDKLNYDYVYEQINWLLESAESNDVLLITDSSPWMYYLSDATYGTYSTWGSWNDPVKTVDLNKKYYILNPERYPNYVIFNKRDLPVLDFFVKELIEDGYQTLEAYDYVLYFKKVR